MKKLMTVFALSAMMMAATATAEGKANGDGFRKAAVEYQEKAARAKASQNAEAAAIYEKLAQIKASAAKLADEGRWKEIDWTEYHKLSKQLASSKKSSAKAVAGKKESGGCSSCGSCD